MATMATLQQALAGARIPGPTGGSQVEFRCGKLKFDSNGTTLRPDTRKGKLTVKKSAEDDLMHLTWTDRGAGLVEDDLIIFPGDATFLYVEKARPNPMNNRVYMLKFDSTSKSHFFWMQEPNGDKDSELCTKVNALINGEETADAGGEGGASAIGQMDQAQLLAMLTQGRQRPGEGGGDGAAPAEGASSEGATTEPAATEASGEAAAPAAEAATGDKPAEGAEASAAGTQEESGGDKMDVDEATPAEEKKD